MSLTAPEQALRPVPNPGASITELWPSLLFLAALLLPFDIAVRRLALPLGEILAKVWARLRRRADVPAVTQQQVVVGRLQQAKQRVQREAPAANSITTMNGSSHGSAVAPKPSARVPAANSTEALLEAKRKRRDG